MTEGGQLASPLACFIAGALVPLTYIYLTKSSRTNDGDIPLGDDDEWDDETDDDDVQPTSGGNTRSSSWGLKDAPYKMVLCVNQELGMGKGKSSIIYVKLHVLSNTLQVYRSYLSCKNGLQ